MARTINWGIIGLGNIANTFASDLKLVDNANLFGVASRNIDRAIQFSKKHNADKYYTSYKELVKDPSIDAVYIATPHTFHFENTMLCLSQGKSVLCEKPMGINSKQVELMVAKAQSKQLFLMEALWTRFIPATKKVINLLAENAIGSIKEVHADFCFKGDTDPNRRITNKTLGGGSLLDVGIYPLYLSLLTLGIPEQISATAQMTETEVDSHCKMLLSYNNGSKALLESSIVKESPVEAIIYGDKGTITIHSPFHHSKKITLSQNNQPDEVFNIEYIGNGYYHEIEEVTNCLLNGTLESTKMPYSMSLNLISLIDRIKQNIGLSYNNH